MKLKGPILSTAVAMLVGLSVLALALLPTGLEDLYARLLQSAASLAAVALLAGLFNLLKTHYQKLSEGAGAESFNSGILAGALVLTFLAALVLGPTGRIGSFQPVNWLFQYALVPVETSLVALLAVSLIYAAARLLRRSPNTFSAVFLATALLVVLGGSLAVSGRFGILGSVFSGLRSWLMEVPAAGGARGLLIGVALGAVAAGLRILMGTDRPYGG